MHRTYLNSTLAPEQFGPLKPELVLKANHVLTEGVKDVASLLCPADKKGNHLGALITLGGSNHDAIKAAVTSSGVELEELLEEDIVNAENATGAATTVGLTTPLTTTMLESEIIDSGWRYVAD